MQRQSKGSAVLRGVRYIIGWLLPWLRIVARLLSKHALRLVTRRGELERLLCRGPHDRDMTRQFRMYLFRSKRLRQVAPIVLRSMAPFNPQQVAMMIIDRKAIKATGAAFRTRLLPNLMECLQRLNGTNVVLGAAEQLRITPYNDTTHRPELFTVWRNLIGPEPQRMSDLWTTVGFQRNDPISDLRRNGMLGLHNLAAFSTQYTQQCKTVVQQHALPSALPLAITSINMTSFVLDVIQARLLDRYFEDIQHGDGWEEAGLSAFDHVFGLIFCLFLPFYAAAEPRDLMDFPRIYATFQARLRADVAATGMIPASLQ